MRLRLVASLLALLAGAARAEPALPPTAADLTGVRALTLGGGRGLAGGNEHIFVNAASLAARRRYAVETHWLLERAGGGTAGQFLTLSAVDSQLSDVTGGFAYTRIASGPSVGNAYHLAFAAALSSRVFAGLTGKYLSLTGRDDMKVATLDASLWIPLGGALSIGGAGYNLVPVGHREQAPRAVGAGVAFGDGQRYNLTLDGRRLLDDARDGIYSIGAGGEMLVSRRFPLRAGFLRDETRDGRWWSAGAGFVGAAGAAIDLLYRQSITSPSDRTFGVALKLLILQ